MLDFFVVFLIIALQISIFAHILFLAGYLNTKNERSFRGFLGTAILNFLTGMILAVYVVVHPDVVRQLQLDLLQVLESGLFFVFLVFLKIKITVRIIRRAKDPANYHFSHFGKKVYNQSIVTKKELGIYFLTMPFTLIIGAYFIVKVFL